MHIKSKCVRLDSLTHTHSSLKPLPTYNMRNAFIPDFGGIIGISLRFAYANHLSDLSAGGVRMLVMVMTTIMMGESVVCWL